MSQWVVKRKAHVSGRGKAVIFARSPKSGDGRLSHECSSALKNLHECTKSVNKKLPPLMRRLEPFYLLVIVNKNE
jgi:hypothetical protein